MSVIYSSNSATVPSKPRRSHKKKPTPQVEAQLTAHQPKLQRKSPIDLPTVKTEQKSMVNGPVQQSSKAPIITDHLAEKWRPDFTSTFPLDKALARRRVLVDYIRLLQRYRARVDKVEAPPKRNVAQHPHTIDELKKEVERCDDELQMLEKKREENSELRKELLAKYKAIYREEDENRKMLSCVGPAQLSAIPNDVYTILETASKRLPHDNPTTSATLAAEVLINAVEKGEINKYSPDELTFYALCYFTSMAQLANAAVREGTMVMDGTAANTSAPTASTTKPSLLGSISKGTPNFATAAATHPSAIVNAAFGRSGLNALAAAAAASGASTPNTHPTNVPSNMNPSAATVSAANTLAHLNAAVAQSRQMSPFAVSTVAQAPAASAPAAQTAATSASQLSQLAAVHAAAQMAAHAQQQQQQQQSRPQSAFPVAQPTATATPAASSYHDQLQSIAVQLGMTPGAAAAAIAAANPMAAAQQTTSAAQQQQNVLAALINQQQQSQLNSQLAGLQSNALAAGNAATSAANQGYLQQVLLAHIIDQQRQQNTQAALFQQFQQQNQLQQQQQLMSNLLQQQAPRRSPLPNASPGPPLNRKKSSQSGSSTPLSTVGVPVSAATASRLQLPLSQQLQSASAAASGRCATPQFAVPSLPQMPKMPPRAQSTKPPPSNFNVSSVVGSSAASSAAANSQIPMMLPPVESAAAAQQLLQQQHQQHQNAAAASTMDPAYLQLFYQAILAQQPQQQQPH